jgi:hypothetical protein
VKIRIQTQALVTAFVCPIALLEKQGHELTLFCDRTPPVANCDHDYTYEILTRRGSILIRPLREFRAEEGALHLLGLSHSTPYPDGCLRAFFRGLSRGAPFIIAYDSAFGARRQLVTAQLRSLAKEPGLRKAKRIVYLSDPKELDVFSLLAPARNFCLSPSTDFVFSEPHWRLLFSDFDPAAPRPKRLCFAGAGTAKREEIVRLLGPILNPSDAVALNARLDNEAYVKELLDSEFSLCLPGAGAWSHRIVESLLLGAIPVVGRRAYAFVEEMVPRDAVILVEEDFAAEAWLRAAEKATSVPKKERIRKRTIIHDIRERHWKNGGLERWITEPFLIG